MDNMQQMGRITRISGPIVEAEDLPDALMYEVLEVGHERLIGELIRTSGQQATIQVYENTSGLRPGEPVFRSGSPLAVLLGPGLIGNIYDGTQRPLPALRALSGSRIRRGEKVESLPPQRKWPFRPSAQVGQQLSPGTVLGIVAETPAVEHRVLVPPGLQGRLVEIAPPGDYTVHHVVGRLQTAQGEVPLRMAHRWPVRRPRPYRARRRAREPLVTGMRVIDTLFPIVRGGTAAIAGGFGTGKTMAQHSLAKWCGADIVIYVGCGERGNEMTDVLVEFPKRIDPRTGRSLMERTVLIANTSNMPVAAREVSIYTGVTIAEYYRDMGYHVAVMADSTSRWAEALRELSARLEEMPAEEGFPAYLPARLAEFYERAAAVETLSGASGSVTIIGAVSPPGGDFAEPVTQHTKRFIRCFWELDTTLANARHYPSIHWLHSYSEYVPDVAEWWERVDPQWAQLRARAVHILQAEDRLQQIVKLVGPDVLPESQRLVLLVAELLKNAFLQQNALDEVDMCCLPGKQVALLRAILDVHERGSRVIEMGAPLLRVRELPVMREILRAKSSIPNNDAASMSALRQRIASQFDELERSYR